MRNLRGELNEWTGEWPPAWVPVEGDEPLVGRILHFDIGRGAYGDVRTCLIEDEDTGDRWSVWLSSKVLLDQFERLRPSIGDRVGIRYLGKRESRNGSSYHDYKVIVDSAPTFSPLGGEEGLETVSNGRRT